MEIAIEDVKNEHLMDYVLEIHIITGPGGQCRCGEDGITCSQRLARVSHDIASALIGAATARNMGGEKILRQADEIQIPELR